MSTSNEQISEPKKGKTRLQRVYQSGDQTICTMRDHILACAKRLFRAKGYTDVSVNDIVSELGITKPTLYHYFEDKEHLFACVLIQLLIDAGRYVEWGDLSDHNLDAHLFRLSKGYFQFCPTCTTTLIRDASLHLSDTYREQVRQTYHEHVIRPFAQTFDQARDQGVALAIDSVVAARMFVSLLDTVNIQFTLHGEGKQGDENFQQLTRGFIDLFLHGLLRSAEPTA